MPRVTTPAQSTATAVLLDGFGRTPDLVATAVDGLEDDDLAYRVDPGANSIAWLVWHTARMQDAQVAGAARALTKDSNSTRPEQVWTSEGFAERFDLSLHDPRGRFGDTGYGDTPQQVGEVRASGRLLTAYHRAVHERTIAFVEGLTDDDYETVVDPRWDPPVTLMVRLVSVLDDSAQHLGQAAFVRGVIERRRAAG